VREWLLGNIVTRITLLMSLITLVPLLILSFSLSHQKKEAAIQSHLANLKVVYKQTISTIETSIQYQKQLLSNIAAMPKIAESLQHASGQTVVIEPSIQAYFADIIHKYGYYDLFIFNEAGDIVYTFKKEDDLGQNIASEFLKNTTLAAAYTDAITLLDTSISDTRYYPPSKQKASFIATPIIVNQKIIGVVALQLDDHFVFDLIKHYNGLGYSGEVVAATLEPSGDIIASIPLKYDPDAFKNGRVLNQQGYATGMAKAVRGESGAGEIIDYRGIETLAVWGYEPTLGWGIIVKTDQDEVLKGVHQTQKEMFFVLVVIGIGLLFLILLSAKWITKPIENLIYAIRNFRLKGSFELKPTHTHGEIYYLSQEFSLMAEELGAYHRDLEHKIQERTQELHQAKKEIENSLKIIDRFVITSSTDLQGRITDVSEAFEKTSGYSRSELIGHHYSRLKDPQTSPDVFKKLWDTIQRGEDWQGELRNISKDGTPYWVEVQITPIRNDDNEIIGYTSICQNITDRKTIEAISLTDQLTTLANRRHLDAMLEQNIRLYERYKTPFSLIMIDLDYFKTINDTFGHFAGDTVLKTVSATLKKGLRSTDVCGRWGGEEFLILLPTSELHEALSTAEKLREAIECLSIDNLPPLTASFGVTRYDGDLRLTLKRVDEALYMAKSEGRNRVVSKI
jgi:diguanylate cyclase (GGDEF)-like protein/PAS domain S-box-containing protein